MNEKKYNKRMWWVIAILVLVAVALLASGVNRTGAQSNPTPVVPPAEWLSGTQTDWVLAAGEYPDFSGVTFPEGTLVEMEVWDETYTTDPNGVSVSMQREGLGGTLRLILPMIAVPVSPPPAWLSGTQDVWVIGDWEYPDFTGIEFPPTTAIDAIVWDHPYRTDPAGISFMLKELGLGGSLWLVNTIEIQPELLWGQDDHHRELSIGLAEVIVPIEFWPMAAQLDEWVFDASVDGQAYQNLTAEQAYDLLLGKDGGTLWAWEKSDRVRFCAYIPTVQKSD